MEKVENICLPRGVCRETAKELMPKTEIMGGFGFLRLESLLIPTPDLICWLEEEEQSDRCAKEGARLAGSPRGVAGPLGIVGNFHIGQSGFL